MENFVEAAVRVTSNMPAWMVGTEERAARYRWSREEEAVLRRFYSRVARAELTERVNEALRRHSGDPEATRTAHACACRAEELGLKAYQGEEDEICLRWAAALVELPYHYVHQAARDGRLATRKAGKQRYVRAGEWEIWLAGYREREKAQERALAAIPEETISKLEAMELTGLAGTHLCRYLQVGVIRAWKVPDRGIEGKGFWKVSRASAEAFVRARREGRLSEVLDGNPDYVNLRRGIQAEIGRLRRAGRLEQRDPLTEPRSLYHPGCFTVAQVASAAGLSAQVVYEAIAAGNVRAVSVVAGGRARYAVEPEEARRYAGWVAEREQAAKRWHNRRRRAIAEAGLLTVRDLAERWGVAEAAARVRARRGGIRGRQWGRYLVFEVGEVERYEAVVSPPSQPSPAGGRGRRAQVC